MRFRLEIRDQDFTVKEIIDKEYFDLSWAYARIGGCGDFNFTIPRRRFEERGLRGDYNIRIYYRNPDTDTHDLWYQGLVQNKVPSINGKTESISVTGHGYVSQLSRIYLNNLTYSSEVSVIVKSILDNYIVPNTDITYSASDIEATSFTPDNIQFNEDAMSAIQKLADIVGGREWGVDKNRKFFFKARSSAVGFKYFLGKEIINFQDNQDFSEIINHIIVQGAQTGGTYATFGPYEDIPSQLKYNERQRVIQNSSVTTSSVASQLATAMLDEFTEVSRRASCELFNLTGLLEATVPIPLLNEISRKIKYGQKRYGTFLYSGLVNRLINRINYAVTDNGSLKVTLDLDKLRPTLSEQIGQLEYNLDQVRSAAI